MKNLISEKYIVIFGAGKIGRSFIGQLFSRAGYQIVFIDVDLRIISEINRRESYDVVIKSDYEEVIRVTDISGILAINEEEVTNAIANCNLMATSVGKNAIEKILPIISRGIEKRFSLHPDSPLDIILAENSRDCRQIINNGLKALLPNNLLVDSYVGLIETSIGKMVPIIPKEISDKDPLLVYAEPYNTLILGKNEFRNQIPHVKGLSPKENIVAWVDRKAFIHNLGHAAAVYFSHHKYPELKYLYEVLADPEVNSFTRLAMKQSAKALILIYPDEFTENDLDLHIDDLINRFQNKALGDTVYRVGHDLRRKLNVDDRVGGAIKLAQKAGVPFDILIKVFALGLLFRSKDESDRYYQDDITFLEEFEMNPVNVLASICGFNIQTDKIIIDSIIENYKSFK
jgi:mannitol-1-phosphate 5-dehydrogenase